MFKKEHWLEDVSIRVMYFLNTMDTFLLFSSVLYIICSFYSFSTMHIFLKLSDNFIIAILFMVFTYYKLKFVDFYPSILIFFPLEFFALYLLDKYLFLYFLKVYPVVFIFTSIIQIIFMGMPMALAARDFSIPFRIYLNSFLIISPTTISILLTTLYQTYILLNIKILSDNYYNPTIVLYLFFIMVNTYLAKKIRKKAFIPTSFLPQPKNRFYNRVLVLNIDGLHCNAFLKSNADFLKSLADNFAHVEKGAHTVYRALTNPAFVSILTGVSPYKHGVVNNNIGQKIKVEALPDFIPTRLYGSMHIRHFSRQQWNTNIFSLVKLEYDKADSVLLEQLKRDMINYKDIKLWVVDFSEVDYCGHSWGEYSKKYSQAINHIDNLIEKLFLFLAKSNILEDSFIIISSDHGLFIGEHSFMLSQKEERVPLIFIGQYVPKIKYDSKISIMDINANISYALGERYCRNSQGRVLTEIFDNDGHNNVFFERLLYTLKTR